MAYSLIIWNEKLWLKDLAKLDRHVTTQILDKVAELTAEPWPTHVQIKKLKSYELADFRLRVGEYRILFDRDLIKKQVILYRVLHRSKLY